MSPRRAEARPGPWALTGTPGVGKSTVGRLLAHRFRVEEVGALARRWGCARGSGRNLVVDLRALGRKVGGGPDGPSVDVVVGHLAHLLPMRGAVVLRCHPVQLAQRLARSRRGNREERAANVVCEATDAIAWEARDRGLKVYEVDTTDRPPSRVARAVADRLKGGGRSTAPRVDWLADPSVTEYLLEHAA